MFLKTKFNPRWWLYADLCPFSWFVTSIHGGIVSRSDAEVAVIRHDASTRGLSILDGQGGGQKLLILSLPRRWRRTRCVPLLATRYSAIVSAILTRKAEGEWRASARAKIGVERRSRRWSSNRPHVNNAYCTLYMFVGRLLMGSWPPY